MKSLTRLLPLLLALAASPAVLAETATASAAASAENPTARLRGFAQNGSMTRIYPKQACISREDNDDTIKIGGSLGKAFMSFIGVSSNDSIGMPLTRTTETMSERGGFTAKVFFQEKVIPANAPIAVSVDLTAVYLNSRCGFSFTFEPQAGKDYEIDLSHDDKSCHLGLNEIVQVDGEVKLEPVKIEQAYLCKE